MENNNSSNVATTLETAGIAALAATSKTPFKTAFMITIGIGLARACLFVGTISVLALVYKLLF